MSVLKLFFISLGTLSLGIGIIGIFVPGLPVTPFVLLAATLYAKSSERLYNWLISNKYLGKYIDRFQKEKGLTFRTKIGSVTLMWLMITISSVFFLESPVSKVILAIVGIVGTYVMVLVIPTIKPNADT